MPFVRHVLLPSRRLTAAVTLALAGLASACSPASAHPSPEAPSGAAASPAPLPGCRYDDLAAARTGYDDWQLTLVDTIYRLPSGYTPPDLVPVSRAGLQGRGSVRSFVVDDLSAMAGAAHAAGAAITSVSAYRSEESQVAVFEEWESVAGYDAALTTAARPGHSEHQLGTAIDFGSPGNVEPWVGDWGGSPQGKWLAANAWRYGFVLSYPPASSPAKTCYTAEPWHYRYFGREMARQIHDSGLSAREYLWDLEQTASGDAAPAPSTAEFARTRPVPTPSTEPASTSGAVRAVETGPAGVSGQPARRDPKPQAAATSPTPLAAALPIAALAAVLFAGLSLVRRRRSGAARAQAVEVPPARRSIRETGRPRLR